MSKVFYEKGSEDWYFSEYWELNKKALESQAAHMLSREYANKLGVNDLFNKEEGDVKPRLNRDYNYFPIPYEMDDDILFQDQRLIDYLIDLVNNNLSDTKYFASTESDKCCVIRFTEFSEDIVWDASSGHLNTPFVVFDENKELFLLLDYDLPIQIVGYKNKIVPDIEVGQRRNFFDREWPVVQEKYKSYTNLNFLVEKYYDFIV